MAKDLVRTRHQIEKFYKLKSQLQGVSLRIQVCYSFLYACSVFLPSGMHFFYLSKINLLYCTNSSRPIFSNHASRTWLWLLAFREEAISLLLFKNISGVWDTPKWGQLVCKVDTVTIKKRWYMSYTGVLVIFAYQKREEKQLSKMLVGYETLYSD